MKTTMLGLILLGFTCSTLAIDKAELDNRIRRLTAKLEEMQQKPDKSIPAGILRKAQGVILLDRTKAGRNPAPRVTRLLDRNGSGALIPARTLGRGSV